KRQPQSEIPGFHALGVHRRKYVVGALVAAEPGMSDFKPQVDHDLSVGHRLDHHTTSNVDAYLYTPGVTYVNEFRISGQVGGAFPKPDRIGDFRNVVVGNFKMRDAAFPAQPITEIGPDASVPLE